MNLALTLEYAARRTPGAIALVDGERRLTWAQLRDRVASLAGGLTAMGVSRDSTVAAVLTNRHETVVVFWACQWLGARFVPISWRITEADVAYCVDDCGAELVVFEPLTESHAPAWAGADRTGVAVTELSAGDPVAGAFDLNDEHTAIMLYTSGTTGRPKGVPRSHRAERAGGLSQAFQHGYLFGDRTLGVMPLFHTMGDHSMLAMSLVGGCYVCQPTWDPEEALRLIEVEHITSIYLAPTLFHDLVHHRAIGDFDLSSVRALGYAGAAMTGALVERCVEVFDPDVFVNHYGSTEIYTYTIGRDQWLKPGCAGRPAVNASLRLVEPVPHATCHDEVEPGEDGEIICHLGSEEAFTGYWNRPDADTAAIRDGWYFTGDLGRIDDDGDLWLLGRTDDMIISGGENIHPLEVEDALARVPGVIEVAVVGEPDDRLGQRVAAYVVVEGEVSADELDGRLLASADLARFKRPRAYHLVESLPKSPSGKILRRLLREQH